MEYEELYRLILDDELGWEHLISTIVKGEGMDPMDIDLIKVTDKFLEIVSNDRIDFRFGGRFVHTAAILLKMKSDSLADDILNKNIEKEGGKEQNRYVKSMPFDILVTPKLPLVRNRRITFTELISAIREAIRFSEKPKIKFDLKIKEIRIEDRINLIIDKLIQMFINREVVSFSELLTDKDRKDFVYTLLPLLFLANMHKIDLEQDEPFAEIYVKNKRIH
ncbi:MAG: segregation/condensation protein A [Candidatus Parvarchaeota archaeon]|nr:segregation/condensation protein A [Candidatus Parvarchaeota archaeon]